MEVQINIFTSGTVIVYKMTTDVSRERRRVLHNIKIGEWQDLAGLFFIFRKYNTILLLCKSR